MKKRVKKSPPYCSILKQSRVEWKRVTSRQAVSHLDLAVTISLKSWTSQYFTQYSTSLGNIPDSCYDNSVKNMEQTRTHDLTEKRLLKLISPIITSCLKAQ